METLEELHRYQNSVLESIQQENNKRDEALKNVDVAGQIAKARIYLAKLTAIKKDMDMIKEKSDKIKARALKLHEEKQQEALYKELEVDRQKEREKLLSPVLVGGELSLAQTGKPRSVDGDRTPSTTSQGGSDSGSSSSKH